MAYAALVVLGFLVALRAAMTIAPSSWLWGVDTLAAAPIATKGIGLSLSLLGALCVLPRRNRRADPAHGKRRESVAARARRDRASRVLLWSGAGIAFLLVAFLPCRHLLLGDGQLYVSSMEQGVRVGGAAHREPLPQATMSAVHMLVGGPAIRAFATTGLLLGALSLLLAALIARRLSANASTRVVIFSAIVLGGGLQLFASYAEYYAFALTAGLLLLWCALRWFDRRMPLVCVGLCYAMASLCHAVFLFVAPAILYLAWLAWRRGERWSLLLALTVAPLAGIGLLVLMHYPFSEIGKEALRGSAFLPPLGAKTELTAYSAVSPAHLIELVDLLLLISPALLVLAPLAMRVKDPWSDVHRFAALLAPGPAFFLLFAHADLGMAPDWDLYVVPVTLVTFAVVVRVCTPAERPGGVEDARPGPTREGLLRGLDLALLLTGLVTAGAWLQSNHDPRQARARLERTAANPALYGERSRGDLWRSLSGAYFNDGDFAGAIRTCVRAIESAPDDRQNYRLLATFRIEQARSSTGDVASAVQQCIRDLEGRRHREGYLYHGVALATAIVGSSDLSLWASQRAVEAEPGSSDLAATLGDALRRLGRDPEARQAYEAGLAIAPDLPRARIGLAVLAGIAGDVAAMRELTADAVKRAPWSPQAQQFQRFLDSGDASPELLRDYFYIR